MDISQFVRAHSDRYIGWLEEACSFASVAGNDDALASMAAWVETKLTSLGAETTRLSSEGSPDAFLGRIGTGDPAIVVYDHYDVQPVDPLDLWDSEPFAPEIRDGRFYARGAADNKGDLVARLAAVDVYGQTLGELPLTLKFFIEGEEETGSRSFPSLISKYGEELRGDGLVWEGEGIDHAGRPAFVFGVKGLAYVELTCTSLAADQHSAVAAYAPSPAWRLVEALTTLRDHDGTVLIDGFYDDVVQPTDADLRELDDLPFNEEAELERLGAENFVAGAKGRELLRRMFFEPTCNIAGIVSGFTVPGTSKTVLPRTAMVKLDMRLVPNQDPRDVVDKLRKHLDARGFSDIEISRHSMQHPVRSPAGSLIGTAAVEAARKTFDQPPVLKPMMLGTGPMYPLAHGLGLPTVSPAGVCRPDSNIHSPNENCRVEDFLKIIEYTVRWFEAAGSAA